MLRQVFLKNMFSSGSRKAVARLAACRVETHIGRRLEALEAAGSWVQHTLRKPQGNTLWGLESISSRSTH